MANTINEKFVNLNGFPSQHDNDHHHIYTCLIYVHERPFHTMKSLDSYLAGLNFQGSYFDVFPKTYNTVYVALIATVSGLMLGFDISSVSAFISDQEYRHYFGEPNSVKQAGITASMAAGSFVGSLVSPSFSDNMGRRFSLQICAFLWVVGAAIQCSTFSVAQLVCGRFISGFGVGFGSSTAPVYVSEVSPARHRGRITGLFQLSVTVGILAMFFIGYGSSYMTGAKGFRTAWGLQMVLGVSLGLGVLFIPESPRWLANHGRWKNAESIISRLDHQIEGHEKSDRTKLLLEELKEQVLIDQRAKAISYFDLFRKNNIMRTMVGVWAQIWQQLCGMNVMMYYIIYVFRMAGIGGNSLLISSSIQYILNVVMTVPALLVIDKLGRRPVLMGGAMFMMIWLYAAAGILATFGVPVDSVAGDDTVKLMIPSTNQAAARAIIACSYLFVCSYSFSWGACVWIYCAEIFPTTQRSKGAALGAASNWLFNFAIAMWAPSSFKHITWKTYIIFGVFCTLMLIHVYVMFPETKGKTLEEIERMWAENIPAWRSEHYIPEFTLADYRKASLSSSHGSFSP